MPDRFAIAVACGFIEILDSKANNGSHFIRAAHITAVRPVWNDDEVWIGCNVFTLDGTVRMVNASFEQIADAIAKTESEP